MTKQIMKTALQHYFDGYCSFFHILRFKLFHKKARIRVQRYTCTETRARTIYTSDFYLIQSIYCMKAPPWPCSLEQEHPLLLAN